MTRLLVGSYTPDGVGESLRLVARTDAGGGAGAAAWTVLHALPVSNPSFVAVARSRSLVFAVSEDESGSVGSYRLGADALEAIDRVEFGERHPCHVVVDDEAGVVLIANYSSGSVTVVPFAADGALGRPTTLRLPPGTGPNAERQEASHAHQVVPTPWGTHLVSDLGGDVVHELVVERAGSATEAAGAGAGAVIVRIARTLELPAGAGPRHMLLRQGALHVVGELDGRVHTFRFGATAHEYVGAVATTEEPSGGPDDVVQPSHLDVSPSGRVLTVLNRGRDTIAVFDADRFEPARVAEHPIGAAWPRHHAHLGESTVVIAAQEGDALIELDLRSGHTRRLLAVDAPACVLPLD